MKYITIILLSICTVSVVSAYVYFNPLNVVERLQLEDQWSGTGVINKIYDSNNGATCYVYRSYNGVGGISCLK